MECNKEEAIRAREIAERKLAEKDFVGAKKFSLKAQSLFPRLEGIPQILTILEVYFASENKVNGETDWYGVLGVNPFADDEAIRKQYRMLALLLHPDKNKSIGADGAFKLLSEAWSLLSDKSKRSAYNQRRFSKGIQRNILMRSGAAPPPQNANGFHNVPKRATSSSKVAQNTARVQLSSVARSQPRTDTFWTLCRKCRMHYEYLRVYLNHTLQCPNCHEPFHACETAPPVNMSTPPVSSAQQRSQNPSHYPPNGVNPARGSSSSTCTNAPQSQFGSEKRRREHEVAPGMDGFLKKRRVNDYGNGWMGSNKKPDVIRDFMQLDTRKLLVAKARMEVRKKVLEWDVESETKATKAAEKKQKQNQKERQRDNENEKSYVKGKTFGVYKNGVSSSFSAVNDVKEKKVIEPVVMDVPDPDFYDFDQDRTEESFKQNQVWASYDDDDGMPRFYAMIHKVISLSPFQVEISWLRSKTNNEFGPLEWVTLGFYKTCGEFRSGKHEISKSLNSFSHKVEWAQGPGGNLRIYPKRGDVWALYRNWSHDWNEHTPDETIHKYDMVEVLEDYCELQGAVYIAPLIKVPGFKTVFRTDTDPDKVRRIPKEEMFRFSHKVPSHVLTGFEGQNAPKGCLELDPAATPLELLQVVAKDCKPTMVIENENIPERKEEQQKKEESKRGGTLLTYSRKQHHRS